MKNIRIVTEEELPKLKNIYYNFGLKELKVGDSVGVILLEGISPTNDQILTLHTFVFDENGLGYILTDEKN